MLVGVGQKVTRLLNMATVCDESCLSALAPGTTFGERRFFAQALGEAIVSVGLSCQHCGPSGVRFIASGLSGEGFPLPFGLGPLRSGLKGVSFTASGLGDSLSKLTVLRVPLGVRFGVPFGVLGLSGDRGDEEDLAAFDGGLRPLKAELPCTERMMASPPGALTDLDNRSTPVFAGGSGLVM